MRRGWRCLMVAGLLAGLIPLLPVGVVVADDAVVMAPCDDDAFDAALATALTNGGGTITFNCGGAATITFTSEKTITAPNTVIIEGVGLITFDGGDATRLFNVPAGATLELRNLALNNGVGEGGAVNVAGTLRVFGNTFDSNGGAFEGGALDNDGGVIEVSDSTFTNNTASFGGAIDNDPGTLTVTRSTFNGNMASTDGGAIFNGSTATITRSTFMGNAATTDEGGAILNEVGAAMIIAISTFSGNTAVFGGAIDVDGGSASIQASTVTRNTTTDANGGAIDHDGGTITLIQTIVADQMSGADCAGVITSGDYNLDSDGSCNLTELNDISDSDNANLGLLADNGGPTETHLPGTGSDAIDNGPATCPSPDQLGAARPVGVACDIGAAEVGGLVPVQIAAFSVHGPVDEGQPVARHALAYGPDNANLVYTFDCDGDGVFETPGTGSGTSDSVTCAFGDDGTFNAGVQVCDGANPANCDTAFATVVVNNVAPTITSITTNAPVPQGQPVTVTVNAIDPGINDVLSYAFDCDNDGVYEVGPQPTNSTSCPIDPGAASTTINVEVRDDDGGVTTGSVSVGQTLTLCASSYTGAVSGPATGGGCPAGTVQLVVPAPSPVTFCINPYTGALLWSPRGSCATGYRTHIIPDDGPLSYCQSLYTGKLRYSATGQCSAGERAGVIPGA